MNNFILLNNPKYNKFNQSSIEQNENDLIIPINPKFILLFLIAFYFHINYYNYISYNAYF